MRSKSIARRFTTRSGEDSEDELEISDQPLQLTDEDCSMEQAMLPQNNESDTGYPLSSPPHSRGNEDLSYTSTSGFKQTDNQIVDGPKLTLKPVNQLYDNFSKNHTSPNYNQNSPSFNPNPANFDINNPDLSRYYGNHELTNGLTVDKEIVRNNQYPNFSPHVLPKELEFRNGSIYSRTLILKGNRYGPFYGKWEGMPQDRKYAWQVLTGETRGWLDGSQYVNNWLKFIRSINNKEHSNVRHFLQCGQLWYETSENIPPGTELTLGPKEPLYLQDLFGDNNTDDLTNTETDSQLSTTEVDHDDDSENDDEPRCPLCDQPFVDVDKLDEHLILKHSYQKDELRCDICPKAYSHRPCLIRHRAVVHGETRKYHCENCPKVFSDPSNLQRHIRTHHAGARSHACPECGKTFATSSGLKQHTHIHSSVKPFQCEVCCKVRIAYTQFSNLCRHKRMHADCRMQIKCVKCGQSFTTSTSLSKHTRFCGTTNTTQLTNPTCTPPALSLNPMAGNNPFSMYRPPAASQFPLFSNHFPPYPPIFPHTGPPASYMYPWYFDQLRRRKQEGLIPSQKKMRITGPDAISPLKERFTPPRVASVSAKVSPPTAEEASSNMAPSPARPAPTGAVFSNPRSQLKRKTTESDTPSDMPKDLSTTRSPSIETVRSPSKSNCDENVLEQPLDLSVSNKKNAMEIPEVENDSKHIADDMESFPRSSSEDEKMDTKEYVSPEAPQKFQEDRAGPHMAYPKPIHPMLLEMPRPNFPSLSLLPNNDRLLPPPIYPPRFTVMHNLQNCRHFDMVRLGLQNYAEIKPYVEVLKQQAQGPKTKDRYACKFCGKVFPRSANLTRHLRTHTGEQPYKCRYCERSFSISSNLQRHVRNIHNKEKPFKCPLCDRCFGQQTNLDRHLKKHEADDGSGGVAVADSPGSSNETEKEDTYFDEIRNFMGKVTYSGSNYNDNELFVSPYEKIADDPFSRKAEDDTKSYPMMEYTEGKGDYTKTTLDVPLLDGKIKQEKEEIFNNNDHPLEVST
ncbi:PR domain zinc finger protein 16-like isoform X2 [Agrilus planipennis]|uniref:PR domain zinc finger protein 16-like isoform X2 n=1 Tax=Agrilus planipennis TaxID=224129 RepID=A0A1W4X9C8_AGRPL|nr:PR domain zinc finger protein 16-like isoform X2 [Agrilus planipennis]